MNYDSENVGYRQGYFIAKIYKIQKKAKRQKIQSCCKKTNSYILNKLKSNIQLFNPQRDQQ